MAIYQCRQYLIDGVNSLVLPLGSYVKTECLTWVNRFGKDLVQVDGDPTGSGFTVLELKDLVEQSSPTETEAVAATESETLIVKKERTQRPLRKSVKVSADE